jgi:hypothetical protein
MHTLNFKHHRAIGMLTLGFNADDIASQCGINRTTLWRWKKHPLFAKVLREKINELANAVKTQIQEIARESIEAVLDGVRQLRYLVPPKGKFMLHLIAFDCRSLLPLGEGRASMARRG